MQSKINLTGNWFQVLPDGKTVLIGDNIGCFGKLASNLLSEVKGRNDLELVINSCGGCALDGLELFDNLKGRVRKVTIVEKCYSSAVILAMVGDTIAIESQARMMVHLPETCCYGKNTDLRKAADMLDRIGGRIASVLAQRTEQDEMLVDIWMAEGDKWFTAQEAVRDGLADEIFTFQQAKVEQAGLGELKPAGSTSMNPTESEILFLSLMRTMSAGGFRVRNPDGFRRTVNAWMSHNVKPALDV